MDFDAVPFKRWDGDLEKMIWTSIGVVSIFWDPALWWFFPLLPIYVLGSFKSRGNFIIMAVVLYLHHIMFGNSGLYELLVLSSFVIVSVFSDQMDYMASFSILSASLFVLSWIFFGFKSAIVVLIEAVFVYLITRD